MKRVAALVGTLALITASSASAHSLRIPGATVRWNANATTCRTEGDGPVIGDQAWQSKTGHINLMRTYHLLQERSGTTWRTVDYLEYFVRGPRSILPYASPGEFTPVAASGREAYRIKDVFQWLYSGRLLAQRSLTLKACNLSS